MHFTYVILYHIIKCASQLLTMLMFWLARQAKNTVAWYDCHLHLSTSPRNSCKTTERKELDKQGHYKCVLRMRSLENVPPTARRIMTRPKRRIKMFPSTVLMLVTLKQTGCSTPIGCLECRPFAWMRFSNRRITSDALWSRFIYGYVWGGGALSDMKSYSPLRPT